MTLDNLDIKRPGHGIEPKYFESIIGKTASVDVAEDTVIMNEYLI